MYMMISSFDVKHTGAGSRFSSNKCNGAYGSCTAFEGMRSWASCEDLAFPKAKSGNVHTS